jgi:translocation and assembly module TamB
LKRPALRVAIQIVALLGLAGLTLLVVGPVRAEVERRIDALKTEAIAGIERTIGRRISYSSISPSVLRYLTVDDLVVHGRADEPADLITVGRLRVYYRPLDLIRGSLSEAFDEIRIENTTLTVDTRRDSDLVALFSDFAGSREAGGESSLIPDNLTLSGRSIELRVASNLGIARVDNLFFSSNAVDDVVSFRGEADVELLATSVSVEVGELTGRVQAQGTVDLNARTALLDLAIPSLSSDAFTLNDQVFQVSYQSDVLEARKVRDRNPVDLYVRFQPDPMEAYVRVLSDGYRLGELVQLRGQYEPLNSYLQGPVSGQASATITESGVTYAGSVFTRVVDLPVPDGDLTVTFSGDRDRIEVDMLDYRTEFGEVAFEGDVQLSPLRPRGRVTLRNVVYGGIAPLSVSGTVDSYGDTVVVNTNRFTYAGVGIEDLYGLFTLGPSLVVEAAVSIQGDRRLEVSSTLDSGGGIRRFAVDARSIRPDELQRIQQAVVPTLQLPDISFLPDSMVVDTRLNGDLTSGLTLSVPAFYAVDSESPSNQVAFALEYAEDRIEVRNATVSYSGYDGSGNFAADLERDGTVVFESDVVVEGIPYEFTGVYRPGNELEIRGLYDVNASFSFGDNEDLLFDASGDIPVPLGSGTLVSLRFDGEGSVRSLDDWAIRVRELTAGGLPYLSVGDSVVSVAGDFNPAGAQLASVSYRDAYSTLQGTGSVRWVIPGQWPPEDLTGSVELVLTDSTGAETYAGAASVTGEVYAVSAVFTELPLLRVGVSGIEGSVSGRIDAEGPADELSATIVATLNEGRFNGDLVEISGVVNLDPETVTLQDVNGRYVRTRFENLNGALSLADGAVRLEGSLAQPGDSGDTVVGLSASGEFLAPGQSVSDLLMSDFRGRAVVSGIPVRNDLPEDWQFALDRSAGAISIAGGPQDALTGRIEQDGSFRLSLAEPVPLQFNAVGRLSDGAIEADLIDVRADVEKLWRIVQSPDFNFVSGIAEGSLRIVGPVNDPDFYGTLLATNVTATVGVIPDLMGPARTFLVFNEKVLSIRETVAPVGPARATVRAALTLDRWLPDQYRVWIDTLPGSPVRVVNDFGGVEIDGLADGSLVLSGGAETLLIEGNVTGSQMFITLSEVEDTVPGSTADGDLIADVLVTAGSGIQFLWPSDAFPILRGFAGAGETVRITHRRSSGTHSVVGEVDIQGGEVYYFDRSFYIKEGRMVFDEDESGFDPLLSVNAEIREVSSDGPLTIFLASDERPLSEFTPRWRSEPPLPEAEIIALLGGNVFVTDSGELINLSQAVLLTSDLFSQFGIITGFENSVRDTLGLDLFSVRTQLFQNLFQGVIDQGPPLDNEVPSLGQYLNNTTLFLGKYLGTDLFLELLVQLRETDPVEAPARTLAGIAVDSELSLEWQTPFFLLEWSFFPRDPSSLFLADNTISFAWEYSY